MPKTVICLLCGGQSTEHEVSLISAKNVLAAIPKNQYDIRLVGIQKDGSWLYYPDQIFLNNEQDINIVSLKSSGIPVCPIRKANTPMLVTLEETMRELPFDVIFPVLHGSNGEDGTIQGLAKLLGVPCVGCGHTASSICMDKVATKQILEYEGIHTAPWVTLCKNDPIPPAEELISKLGLPLFVKPANAGSSVGVVKVKTADQFANAVNEAMQYDDKVLVEKAIVGREIECAVLGNTDLFCAVPGEVVPKVDFYSYDAKYTMEDGAELRAPAPLTQEQIASVQAIARKAFKVLGCRGMSRVDFFLTPDNTFILNEINTIPGFTQISMFPKLMGLSGIAYPDLIEKLIQLALQK